MQTKLHSSCIQDLGGNPVWTRCWQSQRSLHLWTSDTSRVWNVQSAHYDEVTKQTNKNPIRRGQLRSFTDREQRFYENVLIQMFSHHKQSCVTPTLIDWIHQEAGYLCNLGRKVSKAAMKNRFLNWATRFRRIFNFWFLSNPNVLWNQSCSHSKLLTDMELNENLASAIELRELRKQNSIIEQRISLRILLICRTFNSWA